MMQLKKEKMPNRYIIDTNVLVVANNGAHHVSQNDVMLCQEFLSDVYSNSIIYIDSLNLIFDEYFRHASRSGQPGIGDAFAKWLFHNQAIEDVCKIIDITVSGTNHDSFSEFPDDPRLESFDLSDRKFVAVAVSAQKLPQICNASDTDWYEYFEIFSSIGVQIKFICPSLMSNR